VRLRIDGLVNNTNVADETTEDDIRFGMEICEAMSKKTGIPVVFVSGRPDIVEKHKELGYAGEAFSIDIFTRPEWL